MIPEIVGQSAGRFNERYFLTALVPTAVFAPATAAVVLASAGRLADVSSWYSRQSPVSQVLAVLVVAALVWFLATLLASQWNNVVRLYEGYPLVRLSVFVNRTLLNMGAPAWLQADPPGVAGHRSRFLRLQRRAASADQATTRKPGSAYEAEPTALLHDDYPPDGHRVLPTALGNIIRAAEDYGYNRYGFDVIYLWPRLTVVLPPDYLDDVERAIIEYQTPLMVSFGSSILAVSSFLLIFSSISTTSFVLIFGASWSMSWLAYRLSFQAAKDYGDLLRTAVDLFRTELLERWWPELLTIDDDRLRLQTLREFVITGKKPSGPFNSGTSTTRAGLIVIQRVEGAAAPTTTAAETPSGRPAIGARLSRLLGVAIIIFCLIGVHYLDEQRWVLVAKQHIAAFSDLTNNVTTASVRRGSLGDDALESSGNKAGVHLDAVSGAAALKSIDEGAVITRSDVGPPQAKAMPSRVLFELVRRRSEVQALDIHPGDQLLLAGVTEEKGQEKCAGTADTALQDSQYAQADVLAINSASAPDSVSVLVQVTGDDAHRVCLGNVSQVQILRRQP